ncbi:MAG: LamG domain-containing protein, partial [Kiritimatiellaeota bacterium]|nr:LamG domain-containing protein [Kiritimatiellota bacterium]
GRVGGLVFAWENNNATNLIAPSPRGGAGRSCRVTAVGSAYFGRFYDMVLAHGACMADGADRELLAACRKTNELTVEAALTPANVTQGGPARIVTFSRDPGSRNFTLGQEHDKLIFRLRTPRTGGNGTNPQTVFGKLRAGSMTHVVVTYRPGLLRAYLDGKKVVESKAVQGDFRNWTAQHLLFGDEWTRDRDWAGRLEGICVFNRFLSDTEARARYELHRARVAERKPVARLTARCRLLEVTPVPDPRTLQQYSRGLVVYCYEVRKVLEGRAPGRKLLVAHWGVLDRRVVETIRQRKPGEDVTLSVERFADHPELESERRFNDCEELDLPLYYDVSTPGMTGAR